MVIVEGPDGAGKTTLIEAMKARYGLEVAPRVVTKDAEAMVSLPDWVDENLAKGLQWLIFDRHRLISEPIYGPILRSTPEEGFDSVIQMHLWFEKFYDLAPLIIYCLPPMQTVVNNVMGDDDNWVVQDRIRSIYSAYASRAAMDWYHMPGSVIVWDYTTDGREDDPLAYLDQYVNALKEYLS